MYKQGQDFVTELRKDLRNLSQCLNNTVGHHCVRVMRELITIANQKGKIKNIPVAPGFVFGVSRKVLQSKTGISDTTLKRVLHLIAGLGLIKRLKVSEAGHIDEYYGELGIPAQQYRLDALDLAEIRRRWRIFNDSGIDLFNQKLTIATIESLFNLQESETIDTRPEAKNTNSNMREEGRMIRRERRNCRPNSGYRVEKSEIKYTQAWGLIVQPDLRDIIRERKVFRPRKTDKT